MSHQGPQAAELLTGNPLLADFDLQADFVPLADRAGIATAGYVTPASWALAVVDADADAELIGTSDEAADEAVTTFP